MVLKEWAIVISVLALLSGCSSIVKKPEIHDVKSVALISVYANAKVTEKKNRGSVQGWNDQVKQTVSSDFYQAYAKSMQEMGWKVLPMQKVVDSKSYQSNFRIQADNKNTTMGKLGGFLNKLADLSESHNYFTAQGLHPVHLTSQTLGQTSYVNGKMTGMKSQLADMAKELGVDAVVVVQVDYCYEGGTFSIAGTGKGYMTAASTLHAVNQQGKVVINMNDLTRCTDSNNRAESDTGYAMIGGNLIIAFAKDDTVTKMFKEATDKNAQLTVASLKKAMK